MRNLMWAVLAVACLLAGSGVSIAGDTVRLGGPSVQADMQGGTDLVRGYGHGHYGGYRGGYYGGHRGYYGGYYGGFYRPYYAGYYRPYYAGYYGSAYPYSYYGPSYYTPCYYNSYYYPIVGQAAPTLTMQATYYTPAPASSPTPGQRFSEPIPAPGGNGTFPYDGGPRSPIPMPAPGAEVNPANDRGIIPLDGKLVSIPNETTGGFSPVGFPSAQPRATTTTTPRVSYPAYGDEPIPAAPRKINR